MTSRDFCYWLQGFLELRSLGPKAPEPYDNESIPGYQVQEIQKHLKMVFVTEIDPSHGGEGVQDILSKIHSPSGKPSPGGMIMRC